jgi:hypothetical protein
MKLTPINPWLRSYPHVRTADDELARVSRQFRYWALHCLTWLRDSAAQAIAVGVPLIWGSLTPQRGPFGRSRCTSGPWPAGSGCWALTTLQSGLTELSSHRRREPAEAALMKSI